MGQDDYRTIQSVERACRLIGELQERERATVSELAAALELSPGSVHTYLATLKKYDLVHQDGTVYRLGPALIPLGESVRLQIALYQHAKEEVERLSYEFDGTAHLSCEYRGKLLIVYEAYSKDAVGNDVHIRKRGKLQDHIHCTATGKAMLAHMPAERVHEILDSSLPAFTPNTTTDRENLLVELESIRRRGFALNQEEHTTGIRGVGAPVLYDDRLVGAISISGPAKEWKGEIFREDVPKLVVRAANAVEVNLHAADDIDQRLMI